MSAPPAAQDRDRSFIRDLCEAVGHRWEPKRIFVVLSLTAYLDESGTHGPSSVTIMAGAMGAAQQWHRLELEFAKLRMKYGFQVFHTRKFNHGQGDFRGWHPIKKMALLGDFADLTENFSLDGVVITLDNADYEANYKGGPKPRRLRIESKYGLCFRNCLMILVLRAMKFASAGAEPPKLSFILESGHRNWNEVQDIFNETKKELQELNYDILGEITFADKNICAPLMIADSLAYGAYLRRDQPPPDDSRPVETRELATATGITNFRYAPGGLADLKVTMIEKLRAKAALARRPSSSEGQPS